LTSCVAHELTTPDLEAFANYEDMRRYIASRSQRSMRVIDNPTHDSYIMAYNEHHELAGRERQRRAATNAHKIPKLPSEPQLVKFEISDAIEPSAEVKELIRQHRSREEKETNATSTNMSTKSGKVKSTTTTEATTIEVITGRTKSKATTVVPKRPTRGTRVKITRSKRLKRAATTKAVPDKRRFDFQVKLIPFDISDAREPDEQTKELIRHMRTLELQKVLSSVSTSTVAPAAIRVYRNAPATIATQPLRAPVPIFNPSKYYRPKTGKFFMKRKGKRVKRSTPQMIRFELEDAREPDTTTLEQLRFARQSHAQTKNKRANDGEDNITVINKREARMDTKSAPPVESPVKEEVDEGETDLNAGESKRLYVYKEVPVVKAKKSIGSLPVEVQKIITNLMKDHGASGGGPGGAKAYVKYIPSHMVDYRQLKSLYGAKLALPPTYSVGGAGKLSPASYMKYMPPHQKGEQLQVQIHPVPVVEKIRYIYTPVASIPAGHGYGGGGGGHAAEEHAAAQAAAAHAVQAAYAGHNVHAVAEAQAAQVAHAVKVAQQAAEAYGAKAGGEDESAGHEGGAMEHPIVVHEGGGAAQQHVAPLEVHHTYAAEEEEPVAVAIKAVHFKPSKPDPLLNENKLSEAAAVEAGEHGGYGGYGGGTSEHESEGHIQAGQQPAEQYKYEVVAAQPQKEAEPPLIKIEYHGPADAIKQNFKELPEFKQLSTLVGKSTEDQIHGLTYLLAKEMQNKLKMQRKKLQLGEGHGAHGNTAPIVFPHEYPPLAKVKQQQLQAHGGGGIHGRLIGMAKSKEYIPIVEQAPAGEQKAAADSTGSGESEGHSSVHRIAIPAAKQYVAIKVEPKAPLPHSFVEYGLSPNYHGLKGAGKGAESGEGGYGGQKTKLLVEQVIHHPKMKYHGGGRAVQAKAIA
ncbi:PREDICTED: uncharacterized protein LOC108373492, partial [Rhagoletis zephyria]|uniref:uncharacterized protein LOC108373492 n=1 Tax=Rhagoletis zephyria TaxID=28612 RepID=UPI0008112913